MQAFGFQEFGGLRLEGFDAGGEVVDDVRVLVGACHSCCGDGDEDGDADGDGDGSMNCERATMPLRRFDRRSWHCDVPGSYR